MVTVVLTAGLLLGVRAAVFTAVLSFLSLAVFAILPAVTGLSPPLGASESVLASLIGHATSIAFTTVVLYLFIRSIDSSLRRLGQKEREQRGIIRQLNETKTNLEEQSGHLERVNASLEKIVQERTRETRLISEMGDLLQASLTFEVFYKIIAGTGEILFPEEYGALMLLDGGNKLLETKTGWGDPPSTATSFTRASCWALKLGQLHLVESSKTGLMCDHLGDPPPASSLCIPVVAQHEAIGVLHLKNQRSYLGQTENWQWVVWSSISTTSRTSTVLMDTTPATRCSKSWDHCWPRTSGGRTSPAATAGKNSL